MLLGDPLLPEQSARIAASRVVHHSIDPDVPVTTNKMMSEDEGGADPEGDGETDPDRIIVNARKATAEDGLLSDEELEAICSQAGRPFSAYDRGLPQAEGVDKTLLFGSRVSLSQNRHGASEPIWTSFTHVSPKHLVRTSCHLIIPSSIGK